MNIFLIHGAYGNENENWFPWLKGNLKNLNHNVFTPHFPTPQNQNLESWLKVFENFKKYLNHDSIIIGHSLGVAFILNILQNINFQIKSSFLISGFIELLNNPKLDNINKTFIDTNFDFQKIKNNCDKFFIYHSDNDPYVSLDKAENLANNLNEKILLVNNAGHFNIESGYNKFELLLEKIKSS